ncbi:hypothetical protein FOC1_g10016438 [Fusarium oxysporum f. sp. cubense race 1]|uniref:Uncharacterized protein n=1 Tax=Fusarium oxysporum f. sp. cubense (strain race 1) TaxID=1229664 RepID=N4TQZ0_FUSC1|nr:hypothetical protein FOC1_g10016438 [Fusarium oxysporum f. sp. cubense race 1]
MDDPGWSWPAWKFGMKRDDLFHTLHEKYNTFTFNLQDPEAFHHDVYEISRDADTTNSVKTESTTASSVDDASSFFDDEPILTKGPLSIHTDIRPSSVVQAPPSPPHSEAAHGDESSVSSPTSMESHEYSTPPSRSMSFSGSETAAAISDLTRSLVHDEDETSQFDDGDFAVASDSDCAESQSSLDVMDDGEQSNDKYEDDLEEEDDFPTTQFPEDASDGCDFYDDTPNFDDTPTPRQESIAPCYIEYKSVAAWRIPSPRRSPSPSPRSHHPYRREGSSLKDIRRSPEESMSKIQKPMHEQRKRPTFRKRLD